MDSTTDKSSPQQPPLDKLPLTVEETKESLKQPSIYLDSSHNHKIIFDANETTSVCQETGQDVCPLDQPIEQQAEGTDNLEKESKDNISTHDDSHDNEPQPWELVGDRFAPIGIEQVSTSVHVSFDAHYS